MDAKAGKLNVILAESSLELVPRELWAHPAVFKNARRRGKRPGETLLDVSLHYDAMLKLSNREKRGRPDIVHLSLLEILDGPLNRSGLVRTFVHTVNDLVVFVNPRVRLPRNYNRFVGLMEQLLIRGRVPPDGTGEPLLYVKNMKFGYLIDHVVKPDVTVVLSEKGERVRLAELAADTRRLLERGSAVALVIGGFPHGDFSEEVMEKADNVVSIHGRPLETWVVVSRVMAALESEMGLL